MRLTILLVLCSILVGCEKELPIYSDKPLSRDGLLYKPNSNEPLTARVERYYENGQLEILYTAIDGKREGIQQTWHENGQLKHKAPHVNGKSEGLLQNWHENGQPAITPWRGKESDRRGREKRRTARERSY